MKVKMIILRYDEDGVMSIVYKKYNTVLSKGKYFFPGMEKEPTNYACKTPLGKQFCKEKKDFIKNILKAWTINWMDNGGFIESRIWCRDNDYSSKKAKELIFHSFKKFLTKNMKLELSHINSLSNQFHDLIKKYPN